MSTAFQSRTAVTATEHLAGSYGNKTGKTATARFIGIVAGGLTRA